MKKLLALILIVLLLPSFCAFAEEADEEWYRERADALVANLAELSGSEEYLSLFLGSTHLNDQIAAWHKALSAEPIQVQRYLLPFESLIPLVLNAIDVDLPPAAQKRLERSIGSMLITLTNNTQGVNFLAASSVLNISEGYLMPEGFEPCLLVYEYDGICVGVTFAQSGEGVVGAAAQICTKDASKFLIRADASDQAVVSSPLLPQADPSSDTNRTTSGHGVGKRGK